MTNIFNKMKKSYKIIIPVVAIIVLSVAVIYFYREYRYNNYKNKEEVRVYQYFSAVKTNYDLIVTKNLKGIIVDITPKGKTIYYDSTPIYYVKEEKVLFPQEMSVIFPFMDSPQHKVFKYSVYEYNDEVHYLNNNNIKREYKHFFMFDGFNLFFFPYESILKIGNQRDIKLSGMSYVKFVTDTLIYYDKETGNSDFIELDSESITVDCDGYLVNIRNKYYERMNEKILLFEPSVLKSVNEMN